jgi:hypothetical protein
MRIDGMGGAYSRTGLLILDTGISVPGISWTRYLVSVKVECLEFTFRRISLRLTVVKLCSDGSAQTSHERGRGGEEFPEAPQKHKDAADLHDDRGEA